MTNALLFPFKLLGWTAAGAALAVGWKLGSYLVDVASDEATRERFFATCGLCEEAGEQPLWRRTFARFSEE
jgi:hypothetical protein